MMTTQEKIKEVFSNSNIFEIICFYKFKKSIDDRYFLDNLKDKSYSVDNCKILKNEVAKFNEKKTELNIIYDTLKRNLNDSSDFKWYLYMINNDWDYVEKKYSKKQVFRNLWLEFSAYIKGLADYDWDIYIDLYSDLWDDINTKKKGFNIFKNFIEKLNKI